MGTQGIGVYGINSKFASGNLVFYEKAVGRTATGDVLTIGTTAVTVGGTAQAVDFAWYATGSLSFILSASDSSMTLVGLNVAIDGDIVIGTDDIAVAQSYYLYLDGLSGGEYIRSAAENYIIVNGTTGVDLGIAGTAEVSLIANNLSPTTTDGCSLGSGTLMWSDLFLASAGVINFGNGNATITHSTSLLTINTPLTVTGAINTDSVTASSSTTTGSIQTDGGVGIAGALFVGTTGNFAGQLNADATTASSSVTTGALVCDGGLGVAGATYIGGLANIVGVLTVANATEATTTAAAALVVTGGIGFGGDMYVGDDIFLTSGAILNWGAGDAAITHSTGALAITPKLTVTGTGDYTSPAFSVTRTFVTSDFDQTYHAAARVNLDLTNDVPDTKYASALNIRVIGAGDVASGGQLYGLWVDSAGTAAAIGGTFYMSRFSVQAGAAIPTSYMQFQTADPGVTYAFAFVNNAGIPPCTAGGTDCTASAATDPTYTIAVQTPNGNPGYIRVWAAA